MSEPGLDIHVLETRWQALAEELRSAPEEGLPEALDLMEEMLAAGGYDLHDAVARAGEERDVVAEYQAAREVADRVESGEDVPPGDVGAAIAGVFALHDHLVSPEGAEP